MEAKAIVLLSTGIDSPVAAKLMIDKGLEVIGIHFVTKDNDSTIEIVRKQCKVVGIKKLYIVNYRHVLEEFVEKVDRRLTCIFCKRFMLRIAEKIAEKEVCKFLITGENLGQVASQTLDNLGVLKDAVKLTVLQPLLAKDKLETIDIAKKMGTFEISSEDKGSCWAVPDKPVTRVKLEKVSKEEEKVDVEKIIEDAVSSAEVLEL